MLIEQYTATHEHEMLNFYVSLSEKDRRRYAAIEARKLGHGGIDYLSVLFGCNYRTIKRGLNELQDEEALNQEGVRKPGGGRKEVIEITKGIDDAFLDVLKEHTAGDPMDDKVKWSSLGCSEIAKALKKKDSKRVAM